MNKRYGYGAWVRFREDKASHTTYLRLRPDGTVAEVLVSDEDREVTPGLLRGLPLARYRADARSRPDLLAGLQWYFEELRKSGLPSGRNLSPNLPDLTAELEEAAFSWMGGSDRRKSRFTLQPPAEVALTDSFLRDVARAYEDAVAHGERPNIALSSQSDHSKRTVERWVYTARRRGFLAPVKRED